MKKIPGSFLLVVFTIAALAIAGCSKKNDSSTAVTMQNLAGTYTLTAFTVTVPPLPTQNYLDSIPACQRDDKYQLNVNGTYDYIDAGTSCTPADDGSGTWALVGTTKIILDGDTADINKYDGKVLVLSITSTVNGFTGTATQTLTKQ